jgi:quercetin dioxygenase-like cupin family protein
MDMTLPALKPCAGRKSLNNTIRYAGGMVTILMEGAETAGSFALIEVMQKPGAEPPLHVHEREDETFYVLEGNVAVWVGGEVHCLSAGDSIFLPRGVPHTFRIKSPVARALNYISPGGFEQWFRTMGTPAESFDLPETIEPPHEGELQAMPQVSARLGVRILGPAPEF